MTTLFRNPGLNPQADAPGALLKPPAVLSGAAPGLRPAARRWGRATLAACSALTAAVLAFEAAEAASRHGAGRSSAPQARQAAPRGEVFLNGRWVSSSWCDATVPGPDGGPGGPGRGLCDANTPRR